MYPLKGLFLKIIYYLNKTSEVFLNLGVFLYTIIGYNSSLCFESSIATLYTILFWTDIKNTYQFHYYNIPIFHYFTIPTFQSSNTPFLQFPQSYVPSAFNIIFPDLRNCFTCRIKSPNN